MSTFPRPPRPRRPLLRLAQVFFWVAVLMPWRAHADGVEFPPRPEPRAFFADESGLLSTADEDSMRAELEVVLDTHAIPIVVVTIDSLALYGADDLSIETYAQRLFDHWGIGHEKIKVIGAGWGREAEVSWNKGILLLIARYDRKARIELGADFGHTKDATCERIMRHQIIPYFKDGDFPGGVRNGVRALAQMARGEVITEPPRPAWHYAAGVAFALLLAGSAVSLSQRGADGWAWALWAAVFSLLGMLLWAILSSPGRSSGGGGSFGGGFSGGGGATGSW